MDTVLDTVSSEINSLRRQVSYLENRIERAKNKLLTGEALEVIRTRVKILIPILMSYPISAADLLRKYPYLQAFIQGIYKGSEYNIPWIYDKTFCFSVAGDSIMLSISEEDFQEQVKEEKKRAAWRQKQNEEAEARKQKEHERYERAEYERLKAKFENLERS